ncbi:MAG: aspartate dehydrogenase [Candidatus Omnitrophota bacterium]|nr:aspartate dehydrogenase [Candidatus Omnitrophota bacterium]
MNKIRVGIIGCGVIGSALAKAIEKNFFGLAELTAVNDLDKAKTIKLVSSLTGNPGVLSIEELISASDLVIEAASKDISADTAHKALSKGKNIMVMSVGGLVGREDVLRLADQKSCRLYIPSGALCGLDGVKAASMGGVNSVTLTTRKPPLGLEGAPYVVKSKIDLNAIKQETVLFEGTVLEAVQGFPKNINVAAALSLAGIGPVKTKVKIVTSPEYKSNSHEVKVQGEFGILITKTENLPSPQNPKTSLLAVLSAIAALKQILEHTKIGT